MTTNSNSDAVVHPPSNARISREAAHRQSTEIAASDLVAALQSKLGTRLVCFISNRDRSTISRWKSGERSIPDDVEPKLRLAYQVFRMLETLESDHTIRAWFIGMNPQLDDVSPAEAIKEGRLRDVMIAAKSFMTRG